MALEDEIKATIAALNDSDPKASRINPKWIFGVLGGPETIKTFGPHSFGSLDVEDNEFTIYTTWEPGIKTLVWNHGIDAIAIRTTQSANHVDIIYMRGCRTTAATLKEAQQDADWKDACDEQRSEIAFAYFKKGQGKIPKERNRGGFYVVKASYGVAGWDVLSDIEDTLGVKVPRPDGWGAMIDDAKEALHKCECDNCRKAVKLGPTLATRFPPLPLLDVDRNIIPRPTATLADTPTTADPAKVSDAQARARQLGWGGIVSSAVN